MRSLIDIINNLPHPEERSEGASPGHSTGDAGKGIGVAIRHAFT
jgi:hypothetical protein